MPKTQTVGALLEIDSIDLDLLSDLLAAIDPRWEAGHPKIQFIVSGSNGTIQTELRDG